jgi:outer membrane protein OmpA-like peptidoglycan-associated protein
MSTPWCVKSGGHLTFAALLTFVGTPVQAQRPVSVELDGLGTWTHFDESLDFKNRFGASGGLGIFFLKNVAVEGDVSYTETHLKSGLPGDFKYIPIRARLAAHVPLGSSYSRLILGAGYVAARYREGLHETDDGFTGLVGLKLGLSPHFGLRADGIIDYMPSPFNESPTNGSDVHFTVRAGVAVLLGSYPPNQDSIRADSIQRAERARAEQIRLAEQARADSIQRAAQARTDSVQRAERARADSMRLADSLRAAEQARSDSLRRAGQIDSMQMREMLERRHSLVLQGVTFEFNKSRLTLNAQKVLDFVSQSLAAHPEAKIEVAGYTDNVGSAAYNQRLSLARARAVRAYLIQHGVPAEQLTALGRGESDPIAPNTSDEGRAQNRRVELRRTN